MKRSALIAWLPVLTLPLAVVLSTPAKWPAWVFMWLLAWTIFAGCKWLTWQTTPGDGVSGGRQLGYLLAWPGLDAPAFFQTPNLQASTLVSWLFALSKFGFGVALVFGVYPAIAVEHEYARGWVGMVGIVFILHFGVFHLLSLTWRALGVTARPIMDWPVRATSVSDFWGRRWNMAFRDLTHRYLFRPLTARFGPKTALVVGFFFSGVLHDLIVSLPAGGGYGGPSAFFMIQAGALFLERSAFGKRLGLARGVRGWGFTMFVLVGPLVLLFHPQFVSHVAVPFLDWLQHRSIP